MSALWGDFFDINLVKPGMKGYALTVFKGTQIDTVKLEVIDMVMNYNGSRDIILVRCFGDNIEKTGIAQGMSGSPVYFDGKLAGSLSYTWANIKEPIAGVTLIEDIVAVDDFTVKSGNDSYEMKKIASPLILGGISDDVLEALADKFPSFLNSVFISSSGSNAVYDKEKSNIKPGSSIAVKIVDGDMTAAAIGTCTYTEGNKIFMFGHPFYMRGEVNFPVSESYIYTVLSRTDLSFKMGIPFRDNAGVALQDRIAGVVAYTDIEPDMIPVNFVFKSGDKIHLEFVRDEDIISSMLPLMFTQSLYDLHKSEGAMTLFYDIEIFSSETGNVVYKNVISSDYTPIFAYIDIQSILYVYLKNVFKSPIIDSISVNAKIEENLQTYVLKDIIVPQKYYDPGDIINGYLLLNRFRGNDEKIPFQMQIPENIQSDSVMLFAINGRDEPVFELQRSEGKYEFTNLDELNNIIEKLKPANSIILKMINGNPGYSEMNKEYTKQTGTHISQMILMGKKPVTAGLVEEITVEGQGVISGQISEIIKIRRK